MGHEGQWLSQNPQIPEIVMAQISNPRFPHTCRIIRYVNADPMVDQTDIEDDPMQDETEEAAVNDQDSEETNQAQGGTVIYEGVCRSDNKAVTSDNGEFNVSYRTLALPLKQDEWTEDTIPLEGDRIELQRFGYKEYGIVVDKRPSNLGTHILWKYARN